MPRGKVKWFNNAKGYGFIIEDGCTEDLFAHFSSIQMEGYRTLKAGQTVEFEKMPSGKGTHAINIQPVFEVNQESTQPTKIDRQQHGDKLSHELMYEERQAVANA